MSHPHKTPKWQKKLRKLLKGKESTDLDKLQAALTDLRARAVAIEERLQQSTEAEEIERLREKLELIHRHLRKGEAKLNDRSEEQ